MSSPFEPVTPATPATKAAIALQLAKLTTTSRNAFNPDRIPDPLKAIPQWFCWRYGHDGKRVTKPPIDAKTGKAGKSNDPATWSTFDVALARFHQDSKIAGVGLALTPDLGLTAIDADHVIDPETGDVDPKAAELLEWFCETYAEISPSGTGYRLFCIGKPQRSGHSDPHWLELYDGGGPRYMTVTGNAVDGHPAALASMQDELDRLHTLYMVKSEKTAKTTSKATSKAGKATTTSVCSLADRLAMALKNPAIAALYAGDVGKYGDRSTAEIALALRLMTFADGDEQTVAGWMDGSKCGKWNTRDKDTDSYRVATVTRAKEKWDGRKWEDPQRRDSEDTDTGVVDDPWEPDFEPDCGTADFEPDPDPDPQPAKEKTQRPSAWVTGYELLGMKFADPVWLLPDILPECGLFLISGKPKAGKSWFVLQLAMAVVQGGSFLGRDVPDGAVLYLALEDNWRRLQDRMMKLQPDADRHCADFAGLAYRVVAPTVDMGLAAELTRVIAGSKKKIRLVILDTLQKVRGNGVAAGSQYALDYDVLGKLKRVADEQGICLVIVHHLRKADSDDVHDGVSGTNGIAGAADGSLVIVRQRNTDAAVLHITGRDMPENELGLKFDGCSWTFAGTASEVKASGEQNEVFNALKPYGGDGATIKQVCDDLEKKRRTVTYHIGKLVDAGRVRVRNTKPAPHYAVCDGGSEPDPETTKCSTDNAGTRVTECTPGAKHRQKWSTCGNDTVEWVCLSCDMRGTYSKPPITCCIP